MLIQFIKHFKGPYGSAFTFWLLQFDSVNSTTSPGDDFVY